MHPTLRTLRRALAAGLLLLVAGSASAQTPAGKAAPAAAANEILDPAKLPNIVARVNGREVTKAELLHQVELLRHQLIQAGIQDPGQRTAFYHDVLGGFVGEILVYQESKKLGTGATAAEVDEAVAAFRARFPDEAAFEAALQRQGSNREQLRRELEQTLSIRKLIDQEILSKIDLSEEVKRAFYEDNKERMKVPELFKVRHIFLRFAPQASAEQKQAVVTRAQKLIDELRGGADFAALARQHSDDQPSKDQGGELPWIALPETGTAFEKTVAALPIGKLSTPVTTDAGVHVLEVLERQPARVRTYEEVEADIDRHMRDVGTQQVLQKRIEKLRQDAQIEILI